MAFTVWLGQVDKKVNSTKQAEYESWPSYQALWKQDKDALYPTITLLSPPTGGYPEWNCMVMELDVGVRYFWVTGIVSVRHNVWEVSAVIDPLATYKEEILSTSCYVEYGFNTDASGSVYRLADTRQNISQVPEIHEGFYNIFGNFIDPNQGVYVLSAVGKNGGVVSYIISRSQLAELTDNISNDLTDIFSAADTVEEILRYFSINSLAQGSAITAIRDCKWLPLNKSRINTAYDQHIYLGDFDTGVIGSVIPAGSLAVVTQQIEIPWPVDDWKRMNCQILTYFPYIGTVAVPVEQCNSRTLLTYRYCISIVSGEVSFNLKAGDYVLYAGSSNMAASVAIGSSNVPVQQFLSGAVQAVGGVIQAGGGALQAASGGTAAILTGGVLGTQDIGEGAANVAQGLVNVGSGVIQTLTPVVQCTGSVGGSAESGQEMYARLSLLYYKPIDDSGFQAVYGHPVMRMGTPVAGYCKTRGFSFEGTARIDIAGKINTLMDSGVFIE